MSTVLTHTGLLHDYPKSELRTVWETAAPKLGLSPTAIKYVRRLIELTSKQDYLPNSICAVFFGVVKLTQKIGMPRRSINRAEAELAEAGWIVMSCPKTRSSQWGAGRGWLQTNQMGRRRKSWTAD